MKRKRIRLMISLMTLLALCLTMPAGSVWAEGEEYLYVPVEIKDVGGKLPEETSFLITLARRDDADTVSPLPDPNQMTLKIGETDNFVFERAAFTEPGDYLYTVKQEKATGDDNVITEDVTYNITLRVVKGDSGLIPAVDIRKDGETVKQESAVFSNNDKRAVKEQSGHGNGKGDQGNAGLFPPGTGEAFPYWTLGLLGLSAVLGAWGIGRHVNTVLARKEGNEP